MIGKLAFANFIVICSIVLGGFFILKIIKGKLED